MENIDKSTINGATLVSKTISPGQQPIAQRQAFQNASQGERMTTKRPRNDYEKRLKTTLDSPIITYYNVCYNKVNDRRERNGKQRNHHPKPRITATAGQNQAAGN